MSRIEREVLEAQEKTKVLGYYRQMLAIRRLEEAAAKAYSQGKIGGFLHLYIGQEAVAVGDAAVSQGATHEALSLAALWKLPVVFICENNLYSMGTPLSRSLSVLDVSQKALAYGMARDRFDGFDVLRVRDRIAEAVKRARYQSEPTLIEILCYRFRGHSMSDPGLYRTKEEIEEFKKRDCISIARNYLEQWGVHG